MNRVFVFLAAIAGLTLSAPSTARLVLANPQPQSTPAVSSFGDIDDCASRISAITGFLGGLVVSVTIVGCYEVWNRKKHFSGEQNEER